MYRLLSGFLLCCLLSTPCLSSRIDPFLGKKSFKAKDFRAAIRREPDIFQVDQNGDNFLHKAVRHNNAKAIELLADNSDIMHSLYKLNAQKLSAMELCITLGHTEAFEALLDKMHITQFRINNRWGWALMHLVARHNQAEMIRILAKRGLNINAQDKTGDRWTALDVAYFYNAHEAAVVLRELGARAVAYASGLPIPVAIAATVPSENDAAESDPEDSSSEDEFGADVMFGWQSRAAAAAAGVLYLTHFYSK